MIVTSAVETRTVANVRYVTVENLSAIGSDLLMSGKGRVKVVHLAKGGYSVKPVGKNAVWVAGGYFGINATAKREHKGTDILRVDGETVYLYKLFNVSN